MRTVPQLFRNLFSTGSGLLLLLSLCGCFGLQPKPDPTRFYVLTSDAPEQNASRAGDLAVRRVELSGYLDSSQIVVRISPHEVRYRGLHRWASPLDQMLAQAFADAIQRAHPEWRVGSGRGMVAPLALELRMLRFEGDADGTAYLACDWSLIRDGNERGIAAQGRVARQGNWDGDNIESLITTLATLLDAAAVEISTTIGNF